jgi:hypothetical protein
MPVTLPSHHPPAWRLQVHPVLRLEEAGELFDMEYFIYLTPIKPSHVDVGVVRASSLVGSPNLTGMKPSHLDFSVARASSFPFRSVQIILVLLGD